MIFDDAPIADTEGALLVHSLRVGARVFKKGRCLTADDIEKLQDAEYVTITVIRYEGGDLDEHSAAALIAEAAAGDNTEASSAFTGRANLFARDRGLLVYDADALDNINLVHESATIAALTPFEVVQAKQMVATIKIIPFAVPDAIANACASIADNGAVRGTTAVPPARACPTTGAGLFSSPSGRIDMHPDNPSTAILPIRR